MSDPKQHSGRGGGHSGPKKELEIGLIAQTHLRSLLEKVTSQLGDLWILLLFFFFFCYFRASPMAYGGSQARGQIRAVAAGLRHSHSNSKPYLQPSPQLTAMPDP